MRRSLTRGQLQHPGRRAGELRKANLDGTDLRGAKIAGLDFSLKDSAAPNWMRSN